MLRHLFSGCLLRIDSHFFYLFFSKPSTVPSFNMTVSPASSYFFMQSSKVISFSFFTFSLAIFTMFLIFALKIKENLSTNHALCSWCARCHVSHGILIRLSACHPQSIGCHLDTDRACALFRLFILSENY